MKKRATRVTTMRYCEALLWRTGLRRNWPKMEVPFEVGLLWFCKEIARDHGTTPEVWTP